MKKPPNDTSWVGQVRISIKRNGIPKYLRGTTQLPKLSCQVIIDKIIIAIAWR